MSVLIAISLNKIESIDDGFKLFAKFPLLESLDLSFNEFESLKNNYFLNLPKLKHLDLSYNQILGIQIETFDLLKSLVYLVSKKKKENNFIQFNWKMMSNM